MPGRVTSSGKMSLSHTPLSGSATFRRRGRSAFFWEGSRGSPSIRRPVRSLKPALAAAMCWEWWQRSFIYILICWSVAGRPGTSGLVLKIEGPTLPAHTPRPEITEIRAAGLTCLPLG
jgi:hypothetical protein